MKLAPLISTALVATGVSLAFNAMPAKAIGLDAYQVSNDSGLGLDYSSSIGIDVTSYGNQGSQVLFTFTNNRYSGVLDGENIQDDYTITNIYFGKGVDFGKILTFSGSFITTGGIEEQGGVSYVDGKLNPQGNVVGGIQWDAAFLADPLKKKGGGGYQQNGIDTGESLGIVFDLAAGKTLNDVIGGFEGEQPSLAIAMHLQSTYGPNKDGVVGSNEGSEWVATKGVTQKDIENIPEPLTILGTGMAFGFGGLFKREYDKKKKQVKA